MIRASLDAEIERLRAALKPFADKLPGDYVRGGSKFTLVEIEHLLHARAMLGLEQKVDES